MQKQKEGIENFIIKKMEKAHTFDEICVMLKKAGISSAEIDRGIRNVKKTHKTLHQDIAASNKFFPALNKTLNKKIKKTELEFERLDVNTVSHIGLFAGRMRRKDFTVSILFLFSLFFSVVIIVSSFVKSLYPESWGVIEQWLSNDTNGILYMYIPILFAPFTLIFLSLMTRRLHDLSMPGILSFLYLGVFIYPFSEYASSGIIVFDVALFILFIFLLSKRGEPVTNIYGKSPVSHGSTFTKMLNLK
jgi:uncharacterized membrane protein YhaH (DUF805 family)